MDQSAKLATIKRLLGGQTMNKAGGEASLSASLANVDSPAGRKRLAKYLQGISFPHYEPVPGRQGLLVRIDPDGTQTEGRFVNRKFVTAKKRRM